MLKLYLIIGALVLWAASLFAVGYWQNGAGHTAERVTWQAKDNQELAQANAQILQMETTARTTEQKHAEDLSSIATKNEQEKANVIDQKDSIIAKLRNGTLRLRDPGTRLQANNHSAGTVTTSTSRNNGDTTSQLSEQLAEFLVSEAGRADQVVVQLNSCQDVLKSDRN